MKSAIMKMSMIYLTGVLLFSGAIFSNTTWAGEGKDNLPHNHLALFFGLAAETNRDTPDETAYAVGLEYELRFREHWGIGAGVEFLGHDTIRDAVVVVPVSFHPKGNWRVFGGPGAELTSREDKFLVRIGVGYEIPLVGHWRLAPKVMGDFIDGGAITWTGGLAIGYVF